MVGHFDALSARVAERSAKVVVIGQGAVGLPVSMRAIESGFAVVGFDFETDRVAALRSGRSTTSAVRDVQVVNALAAGFVPTGDPNLFRDLDVAVIAPPEFDGDARRAPLHFFSTVGLLLGPDLRPGVCVLVERTIFPGTAMAMLESTVRNVGVAPEDIAVLYAPEHPGWTSPQGAAHHVPTDDQPADLDAEARARLRSLHPKLPASPESVPIDAWPSVTAVVEALFASRP